MGAAEAAQVVVAASQFVEMVDDKQCCRVNAPQESLKTLHYPESTVELASGDGWRPSQHAVPCQVGRVDVTAAGQVNVTTSASELESQTKLE